jgi:predicted RNase H-like nuclease (RuvC/YqgF family)
MDNANAFDVLEDKVRKATELVRNLRQENQGLQGELDQMRLRVAKAEKQVGDAARQKKLGDDDAHRVEELTAEVASLRKDREEIKKRIAMLVDLLEALEG